MDAAVWSQIAPMIVAVVFFITVGGVVLLRPLSKRLGTLLEVYAQQQKEGIQGDVGQLRDLLETMNARLQLIEERQDFTERLLSSGERRVPLERGEDKDV